MSYQSLDWSCIWVARHRGLFAFDTVRLSAGDGLGLTQTERRFPHELPLVAVYPKLQPVTIDPFLQNLWEATGDRKGHLEDLTMLKGSKTYQPSDPVKRINWRLAARGLPLSVNLFETILPKSAHFIVDGESFGCPKNDAESFEEALSILASILLSLDRAQVRCGLTLPLSLRGAPITYPCGTPLEKLLLALAGYDRLPLEPVDSDHAPPPAKPARFDIAPALEAISSVGRCYYISQSMEQLGGSLLAQLDPASLVLLPMQPPDPGSSLGRTSTILPLRDLKRGNLDGSL